MRFPNITIAILIVLLLSLTGNAQQTNPVERQVSNPITDTPNINPISAEQNIKAPQVKKKPGFEPEGGDGEVVVYSDHQSVEGEAGKRIVRHDGNVDVHFGIYRLQAEKITIYEAENRMVAEGSVIFDQGDDQRITGARGEWNYKTKLGWFEDSTGFTNQTNDGTVIYFTADRVERTGLNEVVVTKGKFTACEEATPKWSFTADEAKINLHNKIKLKNAKFRVLDVPIIPLPYASIPIKEIDRSSGFLTPTIGFSPNKGVRLSGAYYQTLGRSADVTLRADIYTSRGLGYGLDLRTRANSRSFFNFGFYAVKDRIFGHGKDDTHPDQGGSIVYAEGVHYFSNGFTAAADVRITSNLAFRQVFSDGIQQIISPIEVSQAFVNKSWGNYTLNLLARSQVISIPNVRIKTSNLPSINFEKRPSELSFLKPLYFSFKTSIEGVARREDVEDLNLYRQTTGSDPIITPALGQRFDAYPQLTLPLHTKYFNFTATGAMRVTYYSNSLNELRQVIGKDLIRKYGEFEFDVRPVAFAKNYYGKDNKFRFRHVIEPFLTYRYVNGVDNFNKIIRFDYVDTATNTNEIEYGITNRIYTRRYSEAVTNEAQKALQERGALRTLDSAGTVDSRSTLPPSAAGGLKSSPPYEGRGGSSIPQSASSPPAGGGVAAATPLLPEEGWPKAGVVGAPQSNDLSIQPYEIFSLTVRGKYFFDKTFGGALIPGERNQIEPITALTFYTFGGIPRRFSPVNIDATYRPQRTIFFNTRMDVGVQGDGLRDISASTGYQTRFLKIFQTFYYTRAVTLIPSLQQYCSPPAGGGVAGFSSPPGLRRGADASSAGWSADGVVASPPCKEAGTLRGSQWSPAIFIGNRDHGLYGGTSLFFDFENRRAARQTPLISSLYTIGYAYNCCSLALQYYTFNVGVRHENRFVFSFRLNGIGSFGTEQYGQGLR